MLAPDSGTTFRGHSPIVPPLPGRSVDTCLRSPEVSRLPLPSRPTTDGFVFADTPRYEHCPSKVLNRPDWSSLLAGLQRSAFSVSFRSNA